MNKDSRGDKVCLARPELMEVVVRKDPPALRVNRDRRGSLGMRDLQVVKELTEIRESKDQLG